MIFVTVGTQLAFPRLLKTVADFAATAPNCEICAQVGPDQVEYPGITSRARFGMAEMEDLMARAEVVIAHAGMGTILSSLSLNTPIVVLPRSAALGEHRNAHQAATAQRLKSLKGLTVAADTANLRKILDTRSWAPTCGSSVVAPHQMISRVSDFIHGKVAS